MRQIMISAGEASGDLHAGALTAELFKLDKNIKVFGMGGDALRAAGGEVLFDIKEHGVMGLVEVLRKLPSLFKLRDDLGKLMDERRPSCLIVIDYPDFNMRLAKLARAKGIPVLSFISPSAWAWRKGRAKDVAKIVTKIAAIFPFERDVYQAAGADVEFVGHPLLDIVHPSLSREEAECLINKQPGEKTVMLLPGSRLQEIERLLPPILGAAAIMAEKRPECRFILPRASTIPEPLLHKYLSEAAVPVHVVTGRNYDIMNISDIALATSGTVTLEAALCGLPSVIVYKTSPVTAFIARKLVKIPDIGLPNIVAGRRILPELLQEEATPENIAQAALDMLKEDNRPCIAADLEFMKKRLGEPGAVRRVAALALDMAGNG